MSTPRVSVLMPVYNADRYVGEAVESILAQTFKDFEFLIFDDGSTDESLAILEGYQRRDGRIRLKSGPNAGYVHRLNEGLALAEGRYIARMDADDIALPERLAVQVEYLEAHSQVTCVGGCFLIIDGAGRLLTQIEPPEDDETLQKLCLAGHTPICHPCAMMRREAVQAVGGYDPDLEPAEDLDLWLRLGEVGKLANVVAPVLKYRVHSSSVSESGVHLQREKMREACERAWKRRGIEGHFEADAPWRPGRDRRSRHRFFLQYGWWAWNSGERRTAITYGAKAVAAVPWRPDGWRLLVCAVAKKPRGWL